MLFRQAVADSDTDESKRGVDLGPHIIGRTARARSRTREAVAGRLRASAAWSSIAVGGHVSRGSQTDRDDSDLDRTMATARGPKTGSSDPTTSTSPSRFERSIVPPSYDRSGASADAEPTTATP